MFKLVEGMDVFLFFFFFFFFIREKKPAYTFRNITVYRGSTVLPKSTNPDRIQANAKLIELDAEDQKLLNDYAEGLTKEGKVHRYVYPPFGVDFGFPDKS